MNGSLERQLLVRRDVRNESGVQRINWREGLSERPMPADACWHLNNVMISEKRKRAVVAQVDDLHITLVGDQGRHEIHRRFGVVGTATPLEQIRLLIYRRVGIDLQ